MNVKGLGKTVLASIFGFGLIFSTVPANAQLVAPQHEQACVSQKPNPVTQKTVQAWLNKDGCWENVSETTDFTEISAEDIYQILVQAFKRVLWQAGEITAYQESQTNNFFTAFVLYGNGSEVKVVVVLREENDNFSLSNR
jgi:hypothetical protein